jgi:hypothetical protein
VASASSAGFVPDIISVDGRMRVDCIRQAAATIGLSGVIILDDAERPEYAEGVQLLHSSGFRSLEFWGLAAGRCDRKCTQLFYRSENILGI